MDKIRMHLPEGATSLSLAGTEYVPNPEGIVTVPASAREECLRHGLRELTEDEGELEPVAEGESTETPRRRRRK